MVILVEDRKSIQETVDFLDRYMSSKKAHPLYKDYLPEYMKFKKSFIFPWLDLTFIYERDYTSEEEKKLLNIVLDYYNTLRKIFKD